MAILDHDYTTCSCFVASLNVLLIVSIGKLCMFMILVVGFFTHETIIYTHTHNKKQLEIHLGRL